jgi:PhnB protein
MAPSGGPRDRVPDVSRRGPEPFETSIAPWLAVNDAQKAVDFYRAAFGAVDVYSLDDHGRVVVAQLSVGGAAFWVQEDADASPVAPGVGSVRMILSVGDPDSVFDRAVAAGATVVAQVHEEHGWRTGRITDPFGHDWEVSRQFPS